MPCACHQNSWVHKCRFAFCRHSLALSALLCFESCPTLVQAAFLEIPSASYLWWHPPKESGTILTPLEGKKELLLSMQKVIVSSFLLLMFLQQPSFSSCGSESLTRSSPIVLMSAKQCWFTSAGDLTTYRQYHGCTLKNNPDKQQRVCLSSVCFFRHFINLFYWLPNTDHLLCWKNKEMSLKTGKNHDGRVGEKPSIWLTSLVRGTFAA